MTVKSGDPSDQGQENEAQADAASSPSSVRSYLTQLMSLFNNFLIESVGEIGNFYYSSYYFIMYLFIYVTIILTSILFLQIDLPESAHPCPACPTVLSTSRELTNHLRDHNSPGSTDCSGEDDYCCGICNKVLNSTTSLDRYTYTYIQLN